MAQLDNYVEEIPNSWGSRIMNSIKGIGFGFVLFLASFVALFWNEGRAVVTRGSLEEGRRDYISVDSERVDSQNEGKLIHLSDQALTQNILSDREFGLEVCALHLKRIVEMYQWKEEQKTRKTSDGKTTRKYSYKKIWSPNFISSENFRVKDGHQNPPMPYVSKAWQASNVKVGDFDLNPALLQKINNFEEIQLTPELAEKLSGELKNFKLLENKYYKGNDSLNPQIGDVQIQFKIVKSGTTVSIIAQQTGKTFCPYPTKAGRKLEMLTIGKFTAESMFQKALSENASLTWILRFAGFFVMFFGLMLILNPIMTLVDVIPIIRDIVGLGVFLVSLIISAVLSLITIAIAWLYYRPIFSIILISIAVILILGSRYYSLETNKKKMAE